MKTVKRGLNTPRIHLAQKWEFNSYNIFQGVIIQLLCNSVILFGGGGGVKDK